MKFLLFLFTTLTASGAFAQAEESEGMRSMRLSCEKHKVALGCYNYANMLIRREQPGSDSYFEQGCKLKHEPSCQQEKWDLPPVVKKQAVVEPDVVTPEIAPEITSEVTPEVMTEATDEAPVEPIIEEPETTVVTEPEVPTETPVDAENEEEQKLEEVKADEKTEVKVEEKVEEPKIEAVVEKKEPLKSSVSVMPSTPIAPAPTTPEPTTATNTAAAPTSPYVSADPMDKPLTEGYAPATTTPPPRGESYGPANPKGAPRETFAAPQGEKFETPQTNPYAY